jgi:cytochrome b561
MQLSERYTLGAIALHWSIFGLVVVVGVLGLLHDSFPKGTQGFWINIHAVVGLLLWMLLLARIVWRLRHTPPALPADSGEFSRRVSVIPIIGVVTFVWHGRIFNFGLFQVDFGVAKNRAIFHPTEDIHQYLAYALFALAGIHALAALWHHFIRHDGVLRRMLPG